MVVGEQEAAAAKTQCADLSDCREKTENLYSIYEKDY